MSPRECFGSCTRVEDNHEMIARLTEKYGYKAHILGAVLQELKQIKPTQDYSGKRFVEFVIL